MPLGKTYTGERHTLKKRVYVCAHGQFVCLLLLISFSIPGYLTSLAYRTARVEQRYIARDHAVKTCPCAHAGGFEQFQQTYPNLCSANDDDDEGRYWPPCLEVGRLSLSSNSDRDDVEQPTEDERPSLRELIISSPPTLIVPYLYIGNAQNALDMDCLKTNGIRYIVNVTNNVPNRSVMLLAVNIIIAVSGSDLCHI